MSRLANGAALAAALLALAAQSARACPGCGGPQRTFGDEISASDVVVLARLAGPVETAPEPDPNADSVQRALSVPRTRFEIVEVLKGPDVLGETKQLELLYFGSDEPQTQFLVQATLADELLWGVPVPLSERGVAYIRHLPTLPATGPERLAFAFQQFGGPEQMLAQDAYGEFSNSSYDDVKLAKEDFDREKLAAMIIDPETPGTFRRLFFVLLGVCAREDPREEEIVMLESIISSPHDEPKPALDMAIGCYLTFRGEAGLPLVENLFLRDKDCPYSETYSAIMAVRFHGQDENIIPRERLLESLRYMLDRPALADLIIPDLARWEDWSAMDRLVALFKAADDIKLTPPKAWIRQKPSAGLELQFLALPPEGSAAGQASVSMARKQATPDETIAAWQAQFTELDASSQVVEERTIAGQQVLVVTMRGARADPANGQTLVNQSLLGAVIELLDGNYVVELSGPTETVESQTENFDQLLSTAGQRSSWVRVPVIQFLTACPLPEAKAHIEELSKIDPDAVKRASYFVGLGNRPAPDVSGDAATGTEASAPGAAAEPSEDDNTPPPGDQTRASLVPPVSHVARAAIVVPAATPASQSGRPRWLLLGPAAIGSALVVWLALGLKGRPQQRIEQNREQG